MTFVGGHGYFRDNFGGRGVSLRIVGKICSSLFHKMRLVYVRKSHGLSSNNFFALLELYKNERKGLRMKGREGKFLWELLGASECCQL